MTLDYGQLVIDSFEKLQTTIGQREVLDAEIAKLQQFVRAAINMLPEDERDFYIATLDQYEDSVGITDAIRKTLRGAAGKWLSPVEIRDQLVESGFNFNKYTSNPLASIHAVLKRLKHDEVETQLVEAVAVYRWKRPFRGASAKRPRYSDDRKNATQAKPRLLLPPHGSDPSSSQQKERGTEE